MERVITQDTAIRQIPVFDRRRIQFQNQVTFGTVEQHSPFRNDVAHGGAEGDQNIVAEAGNADLIVLQVVVAGKRRCVPVRIAPGEKTVFPVFVSDILIFFDKKNLFAERSHLRRQAAADPVD